MIFGKHINRYYFKYAGWMILGLFALVIVDWFQLVIPNMYQMVINGMNTGFVEVDGLEDVLKYEFEVIDNLHIHHVSYMLQVNFLLFQFLEDDIPLHRLTN